MSRRPRPASRDARAGTRGDPRHGRGGTEPAVHCRRRRPRRARCVPRMDDAARDTLENARRKAYTAARSDATSTRVLAEKVGSTPTELASFDPQFSFFHGGVAAFAGGRRVGAVGVSGLPEPRTSASRSPRSQRRASSRPNEPGAPRRRHSLTRKLRPTAGPPSAAVISTRTVVQPRSRRRSAPPAHRSSAAAGHAARSRAPSAFPHAGARSVPGDASGSRHVASVDDENLQHARTARRRRRTRSPPSASRRTTRPGRGRPRRRPPSGAPRLLRFAGACREEHERVVVAGSTRAGRRDTTVSARLEPGARTKRRAAS
jgi:hypothetical protein